MLPSNHPLLLSAPSILLVTKRTGGYCSEEVARRLDSGSSMAWAPREGTCVHTWLPVWLPNPITSLVLLEPWDRLPLAYRTPFRAYKDEPSFLPTDLGSPIPPGLMWSRTACIPNLFLHAFCLKRDLCGLHGWMMPEACTFQSGLVYREPQ